MKKFLSMLSLVLTFSVVMAGMVGATGFKEVNGSYIIKPRQAVVVSGMPGQLGGVTENYYAAVDLTIGAAVEIVYNFEVPSTGDTYLIGISMTASAGDPDVIGVVAYGNVTQTTSRAGDAVDVVVLGPALVMIAPISITAGTLLVQSAVAGQLTITSALTAITVLASTLDTQRSLTVARAMETKGIANNGRIRARISSK